MLWVYLQYIIFKHFCKVTLVPVAEVRRIPFQSFEFCVQASRIRTPGCQQSIQKSGSCKVSPKHYLNQNQNFSNHLDNKTKYFRLRQYDEIWLLSVSLIALWEPSLYLLNHSEAILSWRHPKEDILKKISRRYLEVILKSSWSHPEVILKSS